MFGANSVLTPNITLALTLLLRPRTVGIDSALDLRQPLIVPVNHPSDRDRATDEDGDDRYQEHTQAEN